MRHCVGTREGAHVRTLYWLSFADECDVTGLCLVRADSIEDAIFDAHTLGVGGDEVCGAAIPRDYKQYAMLCQLAGRPLLPEDLERAGVIPIRLRDCEQTV